MVHFYKESSSGTHVKWSAILDKPQLVERIESAENKLIINYEDGTVEEIEVSTTNSGGGNQIIIEELSNPLTMKPLEYGWFKLSTDKSVNQLSIIPFDTIKDGNIEVPKDGIFKLKQGITYEISLEMYAISPTDESIRFECYNTETDEVLITCGKVPTSHSAHMISSSLKGIITPNEDIQIGFRSSLTLNTIYSDHSHVMIQEVRNNPVNQYGGFETEVLFDGNISSTGEYTLSDNVSKYDFLILEKTYDTNIELVPKMTSNTSPVPFVAFASNEYSTSYAAWKVFEKKNSINTDSWMTRSLSDNDFIGIDFGIPTEVTSFSLTCPTGYSSGASTSPPKSFILQGSIDNNQWVDIKEIKNQINWSENETRTYLLDRSFKYRYYRLFLTEKNHSTNQYGIGEIQFYKNLGKTLNNVIIIPTNYNHFVNDKLSIELNENRMKLNQVDSINRIIGIRGQIPSLLVGGEF